MSKIKPSGLGGFCGSTILVSGFPSSLEAMANPVNELILFFSG
jgi:hypothetical protein